jgi:uncharacterized protein YaeQ
VALGATIHHFDIQLSDADRHVYEELSIKVARHPSESAEYLATRVLAYCLEFTEGLAFSGGGLADPDLPALAVRDLTGKMTSWIDVGSPDAARLHRAAKSAPRVAVYTQRAPAALLDSLSGQKIHRADALELYAFDGGLVAALAARLQRRMALELSVTGGHLYLSVGGETLSAEVKRVALAA